MMLTYKENIIGLIRDLEYYAMALKNRLEKFETSAPILAEFFDSMVAHAGTFEYPLDKPGWEGTEDE